MDHGREASLISRVVFLTAAIALGVGVGALQLTAAEDDADIQPRSSHIAQKAPMESNSALMRKLNEILANQEKILANQQTIFQRFDAVMEELRIVKVRASTR